MYLRQSLEEPDIPAAGEIRHIFLVLVLLFKGNCRCRSQVKKEREKDIRNLEKKYFMVLDFHVCVFMVLIRIILDYCEQKSMFQNEVPHPPNDLVCKEPLLLIYTSSGSITKCDLFGTRQSNWKCYLLAEHN